MQKGLGRIISFFEISTEVLSFLRTNSSCSSSPWSCFEPQFPSCSSFLNCACRVPSHLQVHLTRCGEELARSQNQFSFEDAIFPRLVLIQSTIAYGAINASHSMDGKRSNISAHASKYRDTWAHCNCVIFSIELM